MNRLTRAEVLKLGTTRTTLLLAAAGLGLAVVLGFATAAFAGEDGAAPLGSAAMLENVVGVSTIPAVLALLLGVLLSAGEHQHGTISLTYLITPRRQRVVAAKVAGAGVGALVVAVGMVAAALGGSAPRLLAEGASVDVTSPVVATVGGLLLASALLAAVGVLLGLLLRSQVAALVLVLLWFTLLEAIADTAAGGGLRRWLPGGAASTLAGAGQDPLWVACGVLTAWTVGLALVTVPAVMRRDVG